VILLKGMGDAGDEASQLYETATWSANLFGAGIPTGQDTAAPSSAPTKAAESFNWTGLFNAGVSGLQRLFGGGSSAPSTVSGSQLAAAAAAQQAASTRNALMLGGLVLAGVAGVYFLRRRKS
jgi:LPXTG-motif cell wall-anchored protein